MYSLLPFGVGSANQVSLIETIFDSFLFLCAVESTKNYIIKRVLNLLFIRCCYNVLFSRLFPNSEVI